MPVSEGPQHVVDRAANAALEAARASLESEGARLEMVYVSLHAEDTPPGEPTASSAASGPGVPDDVNEAAKDVLAFLVTEAILVGSEIGVTVKAVPIQGEG